jgi:hypothetical protein
MVSFREMLRQWRHWQGAYREDDRWVQDAVKPQQTT